MDKVDHIYKLHQLLSRRRTALSRTDITRELECSIPTVHRTIGTMRDHLRASRAIPPRRQLRIAHPVPRRRELLMDILRHGAQVEVMAPPALRDAVQVQIERAL